MKLCVVGFGLIGGSIAAASRARRPGARVVAVDASAVLASASVRALSDERVDASDGPAVERALAAADLAVLAAPVSAIEAELGRALAHARLVTDCGSTKRAIVASAESSVRRGRFVPGHPLAGGPSGGADAARADLFEGQRWILCPEAADADAFARVEAFVRALGATPVTMSAAEHDRAVALTSHVPQLLASALVVLSERRRAGAAEGPGFAGATRVAGGNPAVWRDILVTNADEIASALAELGAELSRVAGDLSRADPNAALALIESARAAQRSRG
ncbi:MAG: prephenate dehydrogenase/arogenate dehydrogenase family protein [Polyangiaceae bacterium]|nr:prephenate dehydrogenase/arogenate dehydrogenase family protein [Polyangiaceae bacterium]MCL4750511.1 prephenate dehydrogenase/arogenate dehydrogenase family protein [Myxococcales bacterium]